MTNSSFSASGNFFYFFLHCYKYCNWEHYMPLGREQMTPVGHWCFVLFWLWLTTFMLFFSYFSIIALWFDPTERYCRNFEIYSSCCPFLLHSFIPVTSFITRVPYYILHTSYSEGPFLISFKSLFMTFTFQCKVASSIYCSLFIIINKNYVLVNVFNQCRQHVCPVGGAVVH